MKATRNHRIVLVTAPDLKTGRVLARAALAARLVACVNLVPQVESHYWWEGKLESSGEVLLVMKTTRARLGALERVIRSRHPYDTPEFITVPLEGGSRKYLDWISASVGGSGRGAV